MTVEVVPVRTAKERADVYAFRYRVYVEEMNLRPPGADHVRRQLYDTLDPHSHSFALVEDGTVVGSLRCIYLAEVPDPTALVTKFQMWPALEAFGPEAIATTSRFMIDPRLRGSPALLRLMRAAYDDGRGRGIRLNYGDCSPSMLDFYEHMGYRRYAPAYNDAAFGFKLPILMLVGDRELFGQVRSPFFRLAANYPDDVEARDWFARTYPHSLAPRTALLLPEHGFFDLLAERVGGDPLRTLGLLRDLTRAEAERLLAHAAVVTAQPRDVVVRQGDLDDTVYVLLSGTADVTIRGSRGGASGPVLAVGAGDVFGEGGFLTGERHVASVTVGTPAEILVLSGPFLRRFIDREPVVGAKLLHNLSTSLARRLADLSISLDPHDAERRKEAGNVMA